MRYHLIVRKLVNRALKNLPAGYAFNLATTRSDNSDKKLYDVQFFNRYFEDKEARDIQALENLQEDYQTFREEQHKEKVSVEEIEKAFKKYKKK